MYERHGLAVHIAWRQAVEREMGLDGSLAQLNACASFMAERMCDHVAELAVTDPRNTPIVYLNTAPKTLCEVVFEGYQEGTPNGACFVVPVGHEHLLAEDTALKVFRGFLQANYMDLVLKIRTDQVLCGGVLVFPAALNVRFLA